ncbi:sensor histidine kinase [Clostridioides sp. ZZV14-5902]|uniref:sensor histidine kinase n=1 Tax=Clostridioides sp. ZZV14-5902 TaxID=2811486 RepID=UPI001D11F6F4|nr:HAMP domain-containing histidine kinase [Clostridioides sp. ZZV14-5902]
MNFKKFSFNSIYLIIAVSMALTTILFNIGIYIITNDFKIVALLLIYTIIFCGFILLIMLLLHKKITLFCSEICLTLDKMMNSEDNLEIAFEEETLLSRINHRMIRMYEVIQESRHNIVMEKADLQELVSDISHQIKTPIANLKIINTTLLNQNLKTEIQNEFLMDMQGQLDKLEFLMQSMIKTSRLETGIITLSKKKNLIYETIATSLSGILFDAEKKNIEVTVDCDSNLCICHDKKWTSEAIFNILDNAVKYTSPKGKIHISTECWVMYVKIDITDTGKGISESHQAEIFKRFYREEDVHDIDGIGIGLYLSRKIISLQGGYIKVTSKIGKGSTFSIFLPNK